MVDPDSHLALACGKGDRAALELLFRRYVDRVWRYAWLTTRSRDAAGDIVQDTFLRVLKSIGAFHGKSTFATWLFAVTRSATAEWMRGARQRERVEGTRAILRLVQPDGGSVDVSDGAIGVSNAASAETDDSNDAENSRQALRKAIAELPPAQRDALILCEMVGMGIAEAADVLGWGQSRVKVTVFRARRRLREILQPLVKSEAAEGHDPERAER